MKTIRIPIYDATIKLYNDIEKFNGGLCRDWECSGLTGVSDNGCIGMYIDPLADNIGQVVCHEAVHAAYEILKIAEVKHNYHNQEPLAYLVDYIYGEVYKYVIK